MALAALMMVASVGCKKDNEVTGNPNQLVSKVTVNDSDGESGVSEFQYDGLNRLTSITETATWTEDGDTDTETTKTIYEYDAKNNLVKETRESDGKPSANYTTYRYEGGKAYFTSHSPGSTPRESRVYTLNSAGQVLRSNSIKQNGTVDEASYSTYTYHPSGDLHEEKKLFIFENQYEYIHL